MTINGTQVFNKKKIGSYLNMNSKIYIQEVLSGRIYEYKIPVVLELEKLENNSNIYSVKLTSSGFTKYSLGYYDKQSNSINLNTVININVNFGSPSTILNKIVDIRGEIFFSKHNNIIVNFDGNFEENNINYTLCSKDKYEKDCFY